MFFTYSIIAILGTITFAYLLIGELFFIYILVSILFSFLNIWIYNKIIKKSLKLWNKRNKRINIQKIIFKNIKAVKYDLKSNFLIKLVEKY